MDEQRSRTLESTLTRLEQQVGKGPVTHLTVRLGDDGGSLDQGVTRGEPDRRVAAEGEED